MTDLAVSLTTGERSALADYEATIERGIKSFVETGAALMAIRDNRLYRDTHQTFEAYCAERWGLSGRHAYRLIDGARVRELISRPTGQEINMSERAARELAPLLDDPEELRAVWEKAADATDRAPSATDIRRVREERDPPPPVVLPRPEQPAPVASPAPEVDPRAAVQVAMDRHVPDPQAAHREWRRDFLDDVHAVHAVVRRGVAGITEHADDECLNEMYRCAERFAAFAREVADEIAKSRPNVIQFRRTS